MTNVTWPSGTMVPQDPYQFSGFPLHTDLNCPEPFGTRVGPAYCDAACFNSCPMMNPDPIAGTNQAISQAQTTLNYVTPALTAAGVALNKLTAFVTINGSVLYPLPPAIYPASVAKVISNIQTLLPRGQPFSISFNVSWPHYASIDAPTFRYLKLMNLTLFLI